MHVGIAHHLGWAIAVTATDDHRVVDRRRVELLGPGLPGAPIHHEGGTHELHRSGPALSDHELAALVASVQTSAEDVTAAALAAIADAAPEPIVSLSIRGWPDGFPTDVALLRRPPFESRADSVMYLRVLAAAADARGWRVHRYDAGRVERAASALLGERAHEVLHGPRAVLGPPWTKDHRTALAATVVAVASERPAGR